MADTPLFKPEKDYTKEADKVLPEAKELAKVFKRPMNNLLRLLTSIPERHSKGYRQDLTS